MCYSHITSIKIGGDFEQEELWVKLRFKEIFERHVNFRFNAKNGTVRTHVHIDIPELPHPFHILYILPYVTTGRIILHSCDLRYINIFTQRYTK